MSRDYMKQPYEVVEAKLQLAELTIELGEVTREKWRRLETMRDVLEKEECLIKKIASASAALKGVSDDRNPRNPADVPV